MNNKTVNGMKCFLYLFGVLGLGLGLALSAQAASFDCAKGSSKVEHIICGNAEISKLDEGLAVSYKAALQGQSDPEKLKQTQKQWLKNRNKCSDEYCVRRTYEARLAELTDNYILMMSKDANLCNEMLALYNEDMNAYRRIRYDLHELFTIIKWQEDKELELTHALFDINNDGKNELVINSRGRLHGIDIDNLYIFPEDSDVLSKLKPGAGGLHALMDSVELFSTHNNVYFLKDLPNAYDVGASVYFVLKPFIWHGTTYISITDQTPRWIVIAKYKQAEETQDICYFLNPNIESQNF